MFDIIVVTYNPGEKLKTTLDSIYSQDFWDYRVVIKDGASTDNSLNILRDSGYFDDFKSARTTIIEAPDKGIYDAMNVAVESLKCVESTNECEGGHEPQTTHTDDEEYDALPEAECGVVAIVDCTTTHEVEALGQTAGNKCCGHYGGQEARHDEHAAVTTRSNCSTRPYHQTGNVSNDGETTAAVGCNNYGCSHPHLNLKSNRNSAAG